jgi:hypothetical protein
MKEPIKGSAAKKDTPKGPKSHYNMKIKVSQETIDKVKKQGMTKALSKAGKNPVAAGTTPKTKAQAEYVEAVRRLYGETRFQNAINKPKASPGPAKSNFTYGGPTTPKPKSNFTYGN